VQNCNEREEYKLPLVTGERVRGMGQTDNGGEKLFEGGEKLKESQKGKENITRVR